MQSTINNYIVNEMRTGKKIIIAYIELNPGAILTWREWTTIYIERVKDITGKYKADYYIVVKTDWYICIFKKKRKQISDKQSAIADEWIRLAEEL